MSESESMGSTGERGVAERVMHALREKHAPGEFFTLDYAGVQQETGLAREQVHSAVNRLCRRAQVLVKDPEVRNRYCIPHAKETHGESHPPVVPNEKTLPWEMVVANFAPADERQHNPLGFYPRRDVVGRICAATGLDAQVVELRLSQLAREDRIVRRRDYMCIPSDSSPVRFRSNQREPVVAIFKELPEDRSAVPLTPTRLSEITGIAQVEFVQPIDGMIKSGLCDRPRGGWLARGSKRFLIGFCESGQYENPVLLDTRTIPYQPAETEVTAPDTATESVQAIELKETIGKLESRLRMRQRLEEMRFEMKQSLKDGEAAIDRHFDALLQELGFDRSDDQIRSDLEILKRAQEVVGLYSS